MIVVGARDWWMLVLRGALGVMFGISSFLWPGLTLAALVLLFGAYALVDGVFSLVVGITSIREGARGGRPWWGLVLEGVLGIGAGILTFLWPGMTELVLLTFIAVWAIFTGVAEIVAAVQLRLVIENEWAMGLAGALSVLFGIALIIFPGAGAISLIWLIASYALVFGVVLIILGFRIRGMQQRGGATGIGVA